MILSNQSSEAPMKVNVLIILVAMSAFIMLVMDELSSPLLYNKLRGTINTIDNIQSFISPSLSLDAGAPNHNRRLSIDLGGGACQWQPPEYDVPSELDFHKTIIAGFPSGDKRMIFVQMEALTGWPAKDEWDFEFLGDSNHPFIKANYPHHEGIWGWGSNADQVVMMVRNIRRSMVEYHDILWDIGYAKTWEEATLNLDQLYSERPPIEDFYAWRDERVIDECYWYGWFIDYWMEGGLMRDIFTHKITTPEHWYKLMMPTKYTRAELDYDLVVGNDTVVSPSYDPHCTNGDVTDGCVPKAVISAENLREYSKGPAETAQIANVLLNDARMGQYVIASEAWPCIWEELIQKGKGLKTVYDRPGFVETDYNFDPEMLEAMISELDRLIDKYSSPEWNTKATANKIVSLVSEHRSLIQIELNEVNSGTRKLKDSDFLGPKERERRRRMKLREERTNHKAGDSTVPEGQILDFSNYFRDLEDKILQKKRIQMRQLAGQTIEEKNLEKERRKMRLIAKRQQSNQDTTSQLLQKSQDSFMNTIQIK